MKTRGRLLYGGALIATAGSIYLGGDALDDFKDASDIADGKGVVYLDGNAAQPYVPTGENTYVPADRAVDYISGVAVYKGMGAAGALLVGSLLYIGGRGVHNKEEAARDLAVAREEGGKIIEAGMPLEEYLRDDKAS